MATSGSARTAVRMRPTRPRPGAMRDWTQRASSPPSRRCSQPGSASTSGWSCCTSAPRGRFDHPCSPGPPPPPPRYQFSSYRPPSPPTSAQGRMLRHLGLMSAACLGLGSAIAPWWGMNKQLWSPAYNFFMAGACGALLLALYAIYDLEGKIHRVDPDFGSTLTVSNRDSQSNCWVNWKIMGRPCGFQVSQQPLRRGRRRRRRAGAARCGGCLSRRVGWG
jgi:hypothetical protein